jgi:hypothetical protein
MALARILLGGCGFPHHWLESAPARSRPSPGARREFTLFFRALRLSLAAVLLAAVAPVRADNAPPKSARMENRFLFVIETSAAMKSRAGGVERAVEGLLNSGMKGELRKGDTLGFWSYGNRLHSEFPMQVWSEANKDAIAESVERYLRKLHYEKQGSLDKVWPALRQALAKSERLTVIFIYDGEETLRGTPFDRDINALQKQYRREFRAGDFPMVTILSAHAGEFLDYTINYPASINVPHTADPLPPPETNAPAIALAAPLPPPPPANPPVEAKPLRTIEILAKSRTADVPALAAVDAPPVTAAPPAAVTNEVISPPPVLLASAPAPPPPAVTTNVNIADAPPAPKGPPAPVSPPEPAPAVVAAAAPASNAPFSPAPPPAAPPGPMPVTIASTAQQAELFVIAISLLTIAVALVVFLLRRSRGQPRPSLISQSIERPR